MNDREPQHEDWQPESTGAVLIWNLLAWLFALGICWLASFLFVQEWHLAQYLVVAAMIVLAIIAMALYRRSRRLYRRWSD